MKPSGHRKFKIAVAMLLSPLLIALLGLPTKHFL